MKNLRNLEYIVNVLTEKGSVDHHLYNFKDATGLFESLIESPENTYIKVSLTEYSNKTKLERVLDTYDFNTKIEESQDIVDEIQENDSEVENYSIYTTPVYTACAVLNDMKYIHLHACGQSFDTIHNITDDYYQKLSEDFDTLAEIALEIPGVQLANPSNMVSKIDYKPITDEPHIQYYRAIALLEDILTIYINALEANYSKYSSDIQSEFDNIIRFWKKELEFKTLRRGE